MYCLGPKAIVIAAAGACKVRTVEVSVTEESRNNRLNNKSFLFMGTSGAGLESDRGKIYIKPHYSQTPHATRSSPCQHSSPILSNPQQGAVQFKRVCIKQ